MGPHPAPAHTALPRRRRPFGRAGALIGLALASALTASACAGFGGSASADDPRSINVIAVGNPQMEDLAELTEQHFTEKTGIKVHFTILPENELRDKVTQDVATQSGQYDVVTIGAYETPIWADAGWLHELDSYTKGDRKYDRGDILKPMRESTSGSDGKLYAAPFYGESSMLMYRKDLFNQAGLEMPKHPTWQQVKRFAAKLHDPEQGHSGICLRGLPGWGEIFAPLTSVVNTFGGTWFDKNWNPRVNGPGFTKATKFYVNLLQKYGQPGAAQSGFTECLNTFGQGQAAMWYDATSAANSLEDPNESTVAGKVGYAYAPTARTSNAGWLWAWSLAMPETTTKPDAAWKFIRWASSKKYERTVGEELGWSSVPDGKRASTYAIPQYRKAAGEFADISRNSIENADPNDPGVQPRPAVGVQFVGIPEFADLGTKVGQQVSSALTGATTVEQALNDGNDLAKKVAENYR